MASRIRRASTLVLTLEGTGVIGCNYFSRTRAPVSPLAVDLLARLSDPHEPAELFAGIEAAPVRAALATELLGLLDLGFLVIAGTDADALDQRIAREWAWGMTAGLYHFGIKDTEYQGPTYAFWFVTHQVATEPQVPLFTPNPVEEAIALSPPVLDGALGLMRARRSYRGFDRDRALPLAALRDCLYAGFAIVGFADAGIPGAQRLPITMTPSGGARNPFEAYVVVRSVEGLTPGVYHYAGLDNSLARVGRSGGAALSQVVGNQAWFDDAGAIVFLVAHFDRCAWKYPHPTGFRVVLLEAGHVAQNLLLAATAHGLAAAPTSAISDELVEELCGLDRIRQAAVHAVALGVRSPHPSSVDLLAIEDNPHLARSR
ncbi:MAG TPA: SagB/ThcOx family dehydrogenase [Kofleriaceae bacterium]|nr:SagB/ThcOx family dehydrogenase [Kofleriaceae bacterium]